MAPHGIAVSPLFFGHDPALRDYKEARKIKTLDVHPTLPWIATADESGTVTIWDYASESVVLSFAADSLKEGQRAAVAALEAHVAVATALDVAVPDGSGPGLGAGARSEPGAAAGGATEAFISAVVGGVSKKRTATSVLPEDARSGRTGAVRGVRFADEHVAAWACGRGRGDYEGTDVHGNVAQAAPASMPHFSPSLDDLLSVLSYSTPSEAAVRSWSTPAPAAVAPASWLLILAEQRVLILDYATRAVTDILHASLLVEASGPSGAARTLTRGRPSVHSAALIGPGVVAFGCEDGAIRLWAADVGAVVQTVRPASASGSAAKPVTSLHAVCTAPHAVPGTTVGLSPVSALGIMHKEVRVLLVAGAADGSVSVWEVIAGRGLIDNGRGGAQQVRLPGELMDLTLSPASLHAVALGSDKSVTVWDVGARSGMPRMAQSRIGTSSTVAEGGVGSRLMSAISMGSHPALPPNTLLVAGKGPHLELAIAGCPDRGPGADAGIVFYDLRTARPGLPAKLKVYTLARHPFKPDIVAVGTNVGVFVVAIAPHYTAGALGVTHPAWRVPPAIADEPSAEGARVHEGGVVVHVNMHGMLVASDVRVTTPASEEDEAAGIAPACPLPRAGGGVLPRQTSKAALSGPLGLDLSSVDHVMLPSLAPAMPPPSAMAPQGAGKDAPPPPHNAVAQLLALLKSSPVPGSRGVRLRVSGSGRYLAAVWPDHKYYAIYKIVVPTRRVGGHDASTAPMEGGEGAEGEGAPASSEWTAEYVDGGPGLEVAWSGLTVGSFEDAAGTAAVGAAAMSGFDRFVVLEPGQLISGRGPMGGGMAIGSSASAKGEGKGKGGGKSGGTGSGNAEKMACTPATISLRQLPVLADPSADPGKVTIIASELAWPLGLEPTGIWGGPLLAVALVPELGYLTPAIAAPLAASALQFFTWTAVEPEAAAAGADAPVGSDSRYSGAKVAKGARFKLAPAGGGGGMPAPSLAATTGGCGVLWNAESTRVAVLTPTHAHVGAHFSPRRLAASRAGTGAKPDNGSVLELCRVPLAASAAAWHGSSLFLSTLDARTVAVCPPVVDPHIIAELAAAALGGGGVPMPSTLGLSGVVGGPTLVNGSRLAAIVVELQALAPPPVAAPVLCAASLPPSRRGMAHVAGCAPLLVARGHLVSLHWTGAKAPAGEGGRGAPSAAGLGAGGVTLAAVSIGHPGLRACMAASWAGSAESHSSSATHGKACLWAAQWGARLPDAAHTSLARALTGLGALPAALMLPGLTLPAGIALALSKRPDVAVRASSRRGAAWSALECRVAIAYLLRALRDAQAGELLALQGPASAWGPSPNDVAGAACVASEANVVGPLVQAAAFLALAADAGEGGSGGEGGDAVLAPAHIRAELVAFTHRLSSLGLTADAVRVAALLHGADAVGGGGGAPPITSAELVLQVLGRGEGGGLADVSRAARLGRVTA